MEKLVPQSVDGSIILMLSMFAPDGASSFHTRFQVNVPLPVRLEL